MSVISDPAAPSAAASIPTIVRASFQSLGIDARVFDFFHYTLRGTAKVHGPMMSLSRTTVVGVIAIAFGLLTIFSGGTARFGGPEARAAAGSAVPLVLWFNFLAGFAYIFAGVAILAWNRIAYLLSIAVFGATLLVFGALLVHVLMGGAYELRAVIAMIFRSAAWLVISIAVRPVGPGARAA